MPPATKPDSTTGIPDAFLFDESKLAATGNVEKQELYVFQWLSHVEQESKVIEAVSADRQSDDQEVILTATLF